jgi:hypothetical protein
LIGFPQAQLCQQERAKIAVKLNGRAAPWPWRRRIGISEKFSTRFENGHIQRNTELHVKKTGTIFRFGFFVISNSR